MRWFVEVSRVGEKSSDEKYCVEAKQWQAALQEARKLRGDSGPLSKFSIELLDDGYRAVDPKQKLRFIVAKAPSDAALTTEPVAHVNGQAASPSLAPSASPSLAPAPAALSVAAPAASSLFPSAAVQSVAPVPSAAPVSSVASAAPVPSAAPVSSVTPAAPAPAAPAPVASAPAAPAPAAPAPVASAPPAPVAAKPSAAPVVAPTAASPLVASTAASAPAHAEPYAGVPSSNLSPHAPPSAVHTVSAQGTAAGKSPSAFPPRPAVTASRSPSARPPAGSTVSADVIPAAPAVPQGLGPAVAPPQNFTQPSPAIDMPPPSSVLRKRQEEPSAQSPIIYREVAYVVDPGVTRGSVEALLWAAFRDLSRELAGRAEQKFVQLAVFDHKFDKRPERAPLGTLAWKDWRGNPVLTFPLFDGTQPARASVPAPSIKPIPVVKISSSAPPSATSTSTPIPLLGSAPPVSVPLGAEASPATLAVPLSIPPQVAASASAAPPQAAPPQAAPPQAAPPQVAAPQVAAPQATPAPAASATPEPLPAPTPEPTAAIPLTREKLPSHPSGVRGSRPRMPSIRRRAGEDLIGELFETMHDLHFMQGVAEGAEFTLAALDSVVPCDGVLIHVFDINNREFVVTRAKGPGAVQALLHRTPDTEPFFTAVMRRPGSIAIHDVQQDGRILGPRWDVLGVKPQRALCGPVRQGGRYLGMVEVVNPLGDAPFHQTEQNAVDYVCEQFAQFLVNRPIVLDADVILRR